MARRATSSTKGRTTSKSATPADPTDPVGGKTSRRGKRASVPPAEMSVTDAFFPGGEEPTPPVAETAPQDTVKAKRTRKPRSIEHAAETLPAGDHQAEEIAADQVDTPNELTPSPQAAEPSLDASPPAATWDATTGAATFDWPAIEEVAAASGPNQAMAKLLLAARAEGAKSRWPF